MIRRIVFKHSPNGPVVPKIAHQQAPLTEKVNAVVVVLTEADLTSGTTIVADLLANPHFVTLVKKAPQTVFGRAADLFDVAYVQYV